MNKKAPEKWVSDTTDADSPRLRCAGKDRLSLALMDSRNHTLQWLSVYESGLDALDWRVPMRPELNPPLWEAGHIGWFQEHWIGRHVQRQRGVACDPTGIRLGIVRKHNSVWYADSKSYAKNLITDIRAHGGMCMAG